ncbi:MAG: glycosyl hydrolase family 8, partial [Bacteroidales bacterium]|nr:glycosyl hydrolase family 8 [Bacteroidales bacterium]
MKHTIRLIIAAFAVWCWCASSAFAQQSRPYDPSVFIKIDINSGDPAFPYPQFKEYKVGKTLAKYNAEGVTHADMEKTGREAYEIMSHRCRYSKTSQGGVRYISFNDPSVPASTHAPHCSEGDGYMLLMSAIFADQPTFNGLWMWIHDYKIPKVVRYYDGQVFLPNYKFSPGLPLCYTDETKIDAEEGSATDGDDDIALAVLIAYKQWGEWMMQDGKPVLDSKGNPISYKKIAKDFLAAYVDTFMITSVNGDGSIYKGGHTSGDIGIDGYVHGGNKGGDMTQWRQTQTDYPFVTPNCNLSTPDAYADYIAPAYYNEFAKFLEEDGEGTSWQINQYKRGEASSDWLIGQAYKKGMIASAGKFSFGYGDDANVSFTQFSEGEDFRFVLRTILNYMWHGNPETTWDPVAHQPKAGGNTFEKDMADRMADFLKKPWSGYGNKAPGDSHGQCVQMGSSPDPGQPYWSGVCNIMQSYNGDKTPMGSGASPAPYTLGASAAAAVCSGDLDLIADMYRQSEITWDGTNKAVTWNSEERYIGNTPEYFHGFYRCWGLLTHTGNLHAPQDMKREANVKVYMSVDKTYAYVDDQIEYTVQFRNYGSAEATDVKIETELDPNYEVVSIKRGNGTVSGNKITWNVGSIPGFKTGGLAATMDSVSFIVVVKDTLNPRICLTSTISGSNFEEWTSNEYPNHATYTMERNCVDIVPDRTLQLKKKASRKLLNPNDAVTFTLEFENKSLGEASWLNGGRDNVRLSYANYISGTEMFQGYRFWHDAYEAYINPGNYRVSYFMYDAAAMGLYSANNPTGWDFTLNNRQDCYKYLLTETPDTITFHYQRIPSGEDEYGRWNQRLMVQFADYTMAPSSYTFNKIADRQGAGANNFYSLHKGVSGPAFIRTQLRSNPHLAMEGKVKDDWSYKKLQTKDRPMDMQTSALYLLTPCYADINNLGYKVDIHARNVCYTGDIDMTTYDRMLVEEFDGYTWRRILGRAPLPGRECMNVQVVDTIPYELEFHHWVDSTALKNDKGEKIKATYTPAPAGTKAYSGIIKWSVPSMLVGEKDKLVYVCVARNMGCPDVDDVYYSNVAWISSETDSPDSSRVDLVTTCREIPPVGDEQESLFKSADKKAADQGETVTYEVKYINNTGTHVEANCKSTEGWKGLNGSSLPKVDGGHLLLNTEGSYLFAPEYSYGNNGDVYLQLDNCTDAITNTWVVLRWTAGVPGQSNFKGAAVKLTPHASLDNTFKCEVYDNGKCIAKEGEGDDLIIYPGNAKNPEFKFTFVDDHLFMYINNADEEWVDVMKDWKGMSAKGPGYYGMYVSGKTNSGPHLTKFETDLDYAFNVTLYDQLPEELGNITSISDNGSWNESKNFITWPTVATTVETAIPPMETVVRTYTAEVVACVDKYITNMGLATVYGLDTLKVLNTIECGADECNLIKADIVLDETTICDGDSTLLHGYGDDGKDGSRYLYEFFLDDVSLGKASYNGKIYVKKAGSYHVVVTSPVDPTCYLVSDKVKLMINDKPVGPDYLVDLVCLNSKALDNAGYRAIVAEVSDREAEGYSFEWYAKDGSILPAMPSPDNETSSGDYTYLYRLISDKGCYSDTAKLYYPIVDTIALMAVDVEMCPKKSVTLSMDAGDVGNSYKWSTGETTQSITVSEPKVYSVEVTTPDGCVSHGSTEVIALDTILLNLLDVTICPGQSAALDAGSEGASYLWSDNSTSQTLTTDVAGTYSVVVTASNGCESHASATITVADKLEVDLGGDKTVCKSDLPYVLDATSNYDSFEWSDGSTSQTLSVIATGTYKVTVTQGTCSGDGEVTITVSSVADPVADHSISYMVSDTTAAGVFAKTLTAQDGTAITYETGTTLKWYDDQKNELNT